MFTAMADCRDIDLHGVELRYANTRLLDRREVDRLARAIEACGQVVPCIVVADAERLVLIDGYRRVAALRRLGRDTVSVEQRSGDLAQALLELLAHSQSRPLAVLEEALLLRELVNGWQLSQREVAKRSGRDVSWVQRRLQLLLALPDTLLEALRERQLSTWAASRIFAPLARANAEHAAQLLNALRAAPLSTRELKIWFDHYQHAQQPMRERLIAHPRLLLESLAVGEQQRASERLAGGPEGLALSHLRRLERLLGEARQRLATLGVPIPESLIAACMRVSSAWRAVQSELTRLTSDDSDRNPQRGAHPADAGTQPARDQPPAQAVA
jgi:ParB family transcriptional regulator, chromosome partitioning protein